MTMTITATALHAGNATFTVVGPAARYTYRLRRPKPMAPTFVQLLTGPDNTKDYTYLGILGADGVRTTKASKMPADALPLKVVAWAVRRVEAGSVPAGYQILNAGRCCRCGRKLTVPESLASGLGPECAGKV